MRFSLYAADRGRSIVVYEAGFYFVKIVTAVSYYSLPEDFTCARSVPRVIVLHVSVGAHTLSTVAVRSR